MTPNYINLSPNSSFMVGSSMIGDHDIDLQFQHQFFSPSFQHQHDANSSSSSHHSFNFYFNPTQDQVGCNSYHTGLVNRPQQQFDQDNGSVIAFGGSYDCYQVEKKVEKGLKITLASKKEGKQEILGDQEASNINEGKKNYAKWMSSKARMKKSDDHKKGDEREDPQKLAFNNNNYSLGSNNNDESNCSSYNPPIRVCTDCNTTKTPLWRSGPKGPKSLCNACGIRQRKARRALAVAAAAANATLPLSSTETSTPSPTTTPTTTTTKLKIKVNHQKEKPKNNYGINGNSTVPFKKRCRLTTTNASLAVNGSSSSSDQEPAPGNRFEGFLINLRNQLALDHVFPPDEKEAAILLMALSCGLV